MKHCLNEPLPLVGGLHRQPLEHRLQINQLKKHMNTKTIVSVILITLGVVVLAYSGLSFTTPGKPIEVLGLSIKTTDSHFIPPVVGALALVGGLVLLTVKTRSA